MPSLPPCANANRAGSRVEAGAVRELGDERERPERLRAEALHAEQRLEVLGWVLVRRDEHLCEEARVHIGRDDERMAPRQLELRESLQEPCCLVGPRASGKLGDRRARLLALGRDEVQYVFGLRRTDGCVRLADEAVDLLAEPVEAARGPVGVAHALLDHGPAAGRREEERMVVELMTRLERGVVDLGREAAGARERSSGECSLTVCATIARPSHTIRWNNHAGVLSPCSGKFA